jgi:hypothetical protein
MDPLIKDILRRHGAFLPAGVQPAKGKGHSALEQQRQELKAKAKAAQKQTPFF